MGSSNGGMMTQRLMCNVENPSYPSLTKVAAFATFVASMSQGIYDGIGRSKCPAAGRAPIAYSYFVGRGMDTPACGSYPCTPGSAAVEGDTIMPFARSGERHPVYSPDIGLVVSAPEV
jgi:hypothetical protein